MNLFNFRKKPVAEAVAENKLATVFKKAADFLGLSLNAGWTNYIGRAALEEGLEGNTWVAACIRKKMQSAASVPIEVQTATRDGGWETVAGGDVVSLLKDPFPGLTTSTLLKMIVGQMDVQGNFYAKVVRGGRGGRLAIGLIPLPIACCETYKLRGSEVIEYKVTTSSGLSEYVPAADILHIKHANPDNLNVGVSPLQSGGKAVDIDNSASTWQKISMQNRGIPDGIFKLTGDVGVDDFDEARRQVREQYATMSSAREPWVLANAEFLQMSQSLADLDFMEGRRMTRVEICAALDVPPPMIGIYDDATLANIETARKIFWRDGMLQLLKDIQEQLNQFLANNFDMSKSRVRFDFDAVPALRDSLQEQVAIAVSLFGMGIPLAEINRRLDLSLNLDDIPASNIGFLGSGLLPVMASAGGGDDGRMSDQDFDRLMQLIQKVADGLLTVGAAVKIAEATIPGINKRDVVNYFELPMVDPGYTDNE